MNYPAIEAAGPILPPGRRQQGVEDDQEVAGNRCRLATILATGMSYKGIVCGARA